MTSNINLDLFLENLFFFLVATSFFVMVDAAWKHAKPYTLPEPLPGWFKIWFGTIQLGGIVLPLIVMLLWGVLWGYTLVLTLLAWYFVMLGLQIFSEILTLRRFQTVVWVMVPYIYLPYRIWQLYEGLNLLASETDLVWVRNLLVFEIVLWTLNYALDVTQLPRLLRWEVIEGCGLEQEYTVD
ncbi:hypothetical protein [Anabaena sp. PCC 7108]|uniref:hypothetical protein n=1 Tax=Anabaena sp. PCC 7108 TaxID=163908 RepID=UPI00034D0F63|nr:hypothetical protein [Anabaena sp. PCC 7108]